MILRSRVVVTMDGPPIENGGVAIFDGRIIDVGKFDLIKTHNTGDVVDLGDRALLPGLINAHCHLDYTRLRGKIATQKSFTDWIHAINAEKATLSLKDYTASINEGFAEAKRFGTTTIANLTAFPELIPKISPPIRTWWFAELIDVRSPERANELVDLAIQSLRQAANRGLAPHALFTASQDLYRRCEEIALQKNILLTTHLAESREEMEMFHHASGPLYEFMKAIGRPMNDCGNQTPLEMFLGAIGDSGLSNWLVAHLNELTERDFELLEKSKTKFHVVHSPRSRDYFRHNSFEFDRLHSLGFNICLGTDSLASNENLNLFDEMRAFQRNQPGASPDKIFEMVTINPALALHKENALGRIQAGFHADLIAIPCRSQATIFEQIIAFEGPVDWMMKEPDLLAARQVSS